MISTKWPYLRMLRIVRSEHKWLFMNNANHLLCSLIMNSYIFVINSRWSTMIFAKWPFLPVLRIFRRPFQWPLMSKNSSNLLLHSLMINSDEFAKKKTQLSRMTFMNWPFSRNSGIPGEPGWLPLEPSNSCVTKPFKIKAFWSTQVNLKKRGRISAGRH